MNTNPQNNGDHEVHKETCDRLPIPDNRKQLGAFSNCQAAVEKAKEYDSEADGCAFCCKECHTS